MSNRESIDDVRTGIEALVASVDAGPPPPTGTGASASLMGLLRAGLERILRRQFAHQRTTQLETLYLVHDLSRVMSTEIRQLRQSLAELTEVSLGIAENRGHQRTLETALAKLEDRAALTESLADELTAALSGSAQGSEPGHSGARVSQ